METHLVVLLLCVGAVFSYAIFRAGRYFIDLDDADHERRMKELEPHTEGHRRV